MRAFLLPFLLATAFQLSAGSLEQLFESGPAATFLEQAGPLAAAGDADALFLLGKAHHLGKGGGSEPGPREAARLKSELERGYTLVFSCAVYRRLLEPRRTERGEPLLVPGLDVHWTIGR